VIRTMRRLLWRADFAANHQSRRSQPTCRTRPLSLPVRRDDAEAHDPEGGEPAGDDDGAVDEDELSAWPARRKWTWPVGANVRLSAIR
jgi:hypothetical protein